MLIKRTKIVKNESKINLFNGQIPLDCKNLICIASRPGMGKTALALYSAIEYAKNNKNKIYIFSLDLSVAQLHQRLICYLSEIDMHILQKQKFTNEEQIKVNLAKEKLKNTNIIIKDRHMLAGTEITKEIEKLEDCGMVIIENLQLISQNQKEKLRKKDITGFVLSIKKTSQNKNIPIIISSQLPRSLEKRKNKRPTIHDLSKVSNILTRKSDTVILPYRDEYYSIFYSQKDDTQAEIRIAKNNYAQKCTLHYIWSRRFIKFKSTYNV